MELRLKGAEHLGQIRLGLVEVDGQLSLYFYPDEAVRAGLSVLPEALRQCITQIPETGLYACNRCGTTREIPGYEEPRCPQCGRNTWSLALNKKRV